MIFCINYRIKLAELFIMYVNHATSNMPNKNEPKEV